MVYKLCQTLSSRWKFLDKIVVQLSVNGRVVPVENVTQRRVLRIYTRRDEEQNQTNESLMECVAPSEMEKGAGYINERCRSSSRATDRLNGLELVRPLNRSLYSSPTL